MMPILADALIDPWLQAVIQLGCLGIVAFGAHYVLTKTIPSMQEVFLTELTAQRELHSKTQLATQASFVSEIKEQRTLHNSTEVAAQSAFLLALDAQRKDFREMVREYHGTNNEMASRIHELTKAIVNNQQFSTAPKV